MALRALVAFFSGIVLVITTILIPFAWFGDKNEVWTNRLIAIGTVAAVVCLAAIFWVL